MEKFYKWADIFIFTSLRDATGTVVLEAMKFGLPVIALDLHVKLVLKDGAGILIPIKNKKQMISDLKDGIINLYNNYQIRIQVGKTARKKVVENFLWEKGEKK